MDDLSNSDLPRILEKISRYCAYQERCRQDVAEKLGEWKVPDSLTGEVFRELESRKFLDEARFAKLFAVSKFNHNKWGRVRIRYELRGRHIPESLIREALQETGEDHYRAVIRELVLKKYREIKKEKALNIREKIIKFVTGKGFEPELVAGAIKELKI